MKIAIYLVLLVSIAAVGFNLYRLYNQKIALEKDLNKVSEQLQPLDGENRELTAEIDYFQNPDNLEKELRSRFNYAAPGETMVIIIPKK